MGMLAQSVYAPRLVESEAYATVAGNRAASKEALVWEGGRPTPF